MKYILSLVTILVLVGCKSDLATPKGTVSAFIEAMKKGDIEGVKKLITKSDLSLLNTAESLAKTFGQDATAMTEKIKKEFIEKSKTVSYTVKDEKIDGDKAEVNVEVKESDKTTTQPFQLLKEDGNWKISFTSTGLNMANKDGNMNNENINIADSIKKGLEQLKNINPDSLKAMMKDGFEKLKDIKEKNPEAVKKMEEVLKRLKDSIK